MQIDHVIQVITIAAIPVLLAFTLHEAAHAYAAYYCGDMTAYKMGRVTLNPIPHIDPVGTVLVPLLSLALSGFPLGWASTPVNFAALRNPKRDMLWVSIAGPVANIFMAFCWAVIAKIALFMQDNYFAVPLLDMAQYGIRINIILAVLNMLPLPPLDGGRVAVSLLPHRQAAMLSRVEPYGMFILIFMAMTPVLGLLIFPVMSVLSGFIYFIFGL